MKTYFSKIIRVCTVVLLMGIALVCVSFKIKKHYSDYRVYFVNKYWNQMHMQVRVGNNSNPESNPLKFDGNLQRNNSPMAIDYDVFCWYRRDANPDRPDGIHFTNWTAAGCFRGNPCTVDNP